ncbi:Peptide chain release factor 1, mitochondrial [Cladophialophora chaetospira]|uniref:Peptide chain release factor 1, mitochondrial n=1 Tax=Cladophialophora chaetospira TaxID=386627 RepID=A0AA38WZA5_9EURO|nr:Peptide chain release factor 1, mitochondrial [Cladophialophora chaetospira]
MTQEDINDTIADHAHSAKCAIAAGFDGVEIQGGNGYLIEQFLNSNVNNSRKDAYGGPIENRARLALEILEAVSTAIGADRVGVRISPFNYHQMPEGHADPVPDFTWLLSKVDKLGLAYVSMMEPRSEPFVMSEAERLALQYGAALARGVPEDRLEDEVSVRPFRRALKHTVMFSSGGFNAENCSEPVDNGELDGIVFGRPFISNPDLVERLRNGWPLAPWDRKTFYTEGPAGYVDYPIWEASSASAASGDGRELSPILLRRARAIAADHQQLSASNAETYDVAVAKKIGELGPIVTALKEWEDAQSALKELENMLHDPSSDAELRTLAEQDIESITSQLTALFSRLKSSLIPAHPFASMPCMIEIHPGAGGSEASLFAQSLLNMYTNLCARKRWPTTLASYTPDDSTHETGLTDALLEINHPGSYDVLRTEAGVHRVQRVPATEKKGRTHTSAVSVMVLPNLPDSSDPASELDYENPDSDYYINPTEVKSQATKSSGAGGQHVNKTESAIRLTHIPTNTVVLVQEERSQHKNRDKAWRLLRAKIAQMRREAREEEIVRIRRSAMGGVARTGREDKIRTYNFSQRRVTDHRSGVDSSDLDGILGGGDSLEEVMGSVREWMDEGEIRGLVAEEEMKIAEKTGNGKK